MLDKKHRLSKRQIEYSLLPEEKICTVVNKSLRSGDVVESRGDVLVYGDVNPGATVKDCADCGFCEKKCPQHLKVRELLKKVEDTLTAL